MKLVFYQCSVCFRLAVINAYWQDMVMFPAGLEEVSGWWKWLQHWSSYKGCSVTWTCLDFIYFFWLVKLLIKFLIKFLLTYAGNREDQGCKEQILTRKVCYFNHFKNLDGLCCCWCFRECKPSFWILKKICVFMNYKCSMNLHWILTVCRLESFFGGVVATSSTPKRKVRTYSYPCLWHLMNSSSNLCLFWTVRMLLGCRLPCGCALFVLTTFSFKGF